MDKDTRVTCTDCVNWEALSIRLKNYFGCNTALCEKCECNKCSCYDPTSTRRFETRPLFIPRERVDINMYQNCNLIKCIHNMSNSIALCLGVSKLEYDYMNVCWLQSGVKHGGLDCLKYKESSKVK